MTTTQRFRPDPSWFRGLGLGLAISWEHADRGAAAVDRTHVDPAAWADLADRAGVRYAAFTTAYPPLVAELGTAFRTRGIRIGLSVPSSPAAPQEPCALGGLDEILTSYGPLDMLWLDSAGRRDERQFDHLVRRIRQRQPHMLVNDRSNACGDFVTSERQLPITAPGKPWECRIPMRPVPTCRPDEDTWTPPEALIRLLVEAAALGGNLLLEVCPNRAGRLPSEVVERLTAYADWMDRYAESVQNVIPGLELWQCRGPSTRRTGPDGERVYLHLMTPPHDEIIVRGMPVRRVRGASALRNGRALPFTAYPYLNDVRGRAADPVGDVRIDLTNVEIDEVGTVVALDLADAPLR